MLQELSFRTKVVLVMVIVLLLFGLCSIFSPMFVLATFYFDSRNIVLSPVSENYTFLMLAFTSLLMGIGLLAWRKSKGTIAGFGLTVVLFCAFYYASTIGYFVIHEDYVRTVSVFGQQELMWEEMDLIDYTFEYGYAGTYTFIKGVEEIAIVETGQFSHGVSSAIRHIAQRHGILIERNEIK